MIERLAWLPSKSCYINLKFFETLKNTPNTSEGFKFVAFVVLEILGGGVLFDPLWCLVWVPKPLVPEGLSFSRVIDNKNTVPEITNHCSFQSSPLFSNNKATVLSIVLSKTECPCSFQSSPLFLNNKAIVLSIVLSKTECPCSFQSSPLFLNNKAIVLSIVSSKTECPCFFQSSPLFLNNKAIVLSIVLSKTECPCL